MTDCPICTEPRDDFKTCGRCSQSVCLDCYDHLLQQPFVKCPYCREVFEDFGTLSSLLHIPTFVENVMDELTVLLTPTEFDELHESTISEFLLSHFVLTLLEND